MKNGLIKVFTEVSQVFGGNCSGGGGGWFLLRKLTNNDS